MGNTSVNQTDIIAAWQSPYVVEHISVRISRLCVESAIAFLGLAWNTLACLVISRERKQTFVKFYILNLAIADIGILTLNFPLAVVREQFPMRWPLGEVICVMIYPLTEVFYGASVWSIAAIAIERHRNIVRRFFNRVRRPAYKPKHVKWIILLIWLISFLAVAFPLFFVVEYRDDPQGELCLFNWSDEMHKSYVLSLTVFFYLLPLVIITITYVQISQQIQQSNAFHRIMIESLDRCSFASTRMRRQEEVKRLKQNATTKRFLTPLVLTFLFTMLPLNTLRLVVLFWAGIEHNKYFLVLYNICVTCVIVNAAADPLIYSIVSKKLRTDMKNFVTSFLPCSSASSRQDVSLQLVSVAPLIPDQVSPIATQASGISEQNSSVSDGIRITLV